MKYYIYPTQSKKMALNPYISNFCKALADIGIVVNDYKISGPSVFDLLKSLFKADAYIFNWIENAPFRKMGTLQAVLFLSVILPVLRMRHAKIIWIFHNFESHEGNSILSLTIRKMMMKVSDAIFAHSEEAYDYLKRKNLKHPKVVFVNHPIVDRLGEEDQKTADYQYDILIWGSILPYKGISEFVHYMFERKSPLKVKIIGKCKDKNYERQILQFITPQIDYENRTASFDELEVLIHESKFTLFPYLKQSVSSSGALMDTISYGGTAIGPDRGAFLDMQKLGGCYVFKSYDEVIDIVTTKDPIQISTLRTIIDENSWRHFADVVNNHSAS